MKIAIAHTSPLFSEAIAKLLKKETNHQVIWMVNNGLDAVMHCQQERPDILLLDVTVSVMNGVATTAQIMQNTPCAILIITLQHAEETSKIFEAMGYGALDVVTMTSWFATCSGIEAYNLLCKIDIIECLLGYSHLRKAADSRRNAYQRMVSGSSYPLLLAIGASTGGPIAISYILRHVPLNLPLAIVIIQHVDAKFNEGLAYWLQDQTGRVVRIAQDGDMPTPGIVFLAGVNRHLIITAQRTFSYTSTPKDLLYNPSIDIFFQSLAQYWLRPSLALLLTGMGSDGASGLKRLREHKWHTIAEDKKSCVVYGMSRAAIEKGAPVQVLPYGEIPDAIVQSVQFTIGGYL